MKILVTGATGRIGRHLATQLLTDGHHVRALTRSSATATLPDAVDVMTGDLTDVDTLRDAFSGADAVHLITFGGDDGADLSNGADIIDLAEASGVRRVSVLAGWAPTSIEEALRSSSIDWCRIEPLEVMYNTWDWAQEITARSSVSTLAAYPSALVHEADIAGVAACALTQEGHAGQNYRVTGPEALTPAQRTAILSEATGRPLTHIQLTEAEERDRLASHGFGEEYVEFGIQLATEPPAEAGDVLDTVPRITGRPGRTFAEWARTYAHDW